MLLRVRSLVFAAILVGLLALPAAASAAIVTIGSSLQSAFEPGRCEGEKPFNLCTVVQSTLPNATVRSPVDGTVIRWHILDGNPNGKYRLRVVNVLLGPTLFGTASSPVVSPLGGGVETFASSVPIKTGQAIGVDLLGLSSTLGSAPSPQASYLFTEPPAPQEVEQHVEEFGGPEAGAEIALNAEVLPPPTISTVVPAIGSAKSTITFIGANLLEVTGVSFGGVPAVFTPGADSVLSATVPPGTPGAKVPIAVTTLAGSATAPAHYVYPACRVPKLAHRKLKAAKRGIRGGDCKVGDVLKAKGVTAKTGRVVKQVPKPGAVVAPGTKVTVKLG